MKHLRRSARLAVSLLGAFGADLIGIAGIAAYTYGTAVLFGGWAWIVLGVSLVGVVRLSAPRVRRSR